MSGRTNSDGGGGRTQGSVTAAELFPYDEPYPEQKDAIERSKEPLEEGGFIGAEAACGTGKTLFALTRGLELVRDPASKYKRIFVLTSVRQQLRAFEDDLEAINANLPAGVNDVSALTLVGKKHLCPYTQAQDPAIDGDDIYGTCDDLRDPVRNLISEGGSANAVRQQLTKMTKQAEPAQSSGTALQDSADDWVSPYSTEIPENGGDDSEGSGFCPFYAEYRSQFAGQDGYNPSGVMRPSDMLRYGAEHGMCPHALMLSGLENVEVLIGNYQHVFHPLTVTAMTGSVIGDETLVIVDEAHGLSEGVRSELSDELAVQTVRGALDELKDIRNSSGEIRQQLNDELCAMVGGKTVEDTIDFLEALNERLEEYIVDMLDSEDSDWHRRSHGRLPDEIRQGLRDPEEPAPDDISEWISLAGWTEEFDQVDAVATALSEAYDTVEDETGYSVDNSDMVTAGTLLGRWRQCDHQSYFRQFYLDKRKTAWENRSGYSEHYTAKLHLRNCIPKAEIADRLGEFGGGILMSATLSPMKVFTETVGLAELEDEGRRVEEFVYGLRYPEENRESVALKLPKFTRNNRGKNARFANDEQQEVRDSYYQAAKDTIQTTDGNVLICLPNYAEADWIAQRLKGDRSIRRPVRADGSDVDSNKIRRWFVDGGNKVLCTGLRGTLTEGVDYDGDALEACFVVGLPLRDIGGDYPDAIETAYAEEFGSANSFEYAFTLPAVHKSRQALGRVIRGADEVGVRVLADRRYATDYRWDDVREFLPQYEQDDYDPVDPEDLRSRLESFWASHEEGPEVTDGGEMLDEQASTDPPCGDDDRQLSGDGGAEKASRQAGISDWE